MKLYYCETPNPRKACAVAKHLDAPVEYEFVDLKTGAHKAPDYVALNPNAKVPVLIDGDVTLWESNAIMCYIADKMGSDLFPKDHRLYDIVRWLSWDIAHFTRHAGRIVFQRVIKAQLDMGEPDNAEIEEAMGFFHQFASVLDAHLAQNDFLVGNALTVADFGPACMLPATEPAGLPLADYPNLTKWYGRLCELPAWQEPFPTPSAAAAE